MNLDILYDELNDKKLLEQYGFIKDKDKYIYKTDLNDDLYVKIIISNKLEVKVIDKNFSDEYLPYKNNINGIYSSLIDEKVNYILKDIKDKCVKKNNLVNNLKKHLKEKYNSNLEYPWEDSPDYFTAKVDNKWYILYMKIKYKSLGIDSNEEVDVVNIKLDPEEINNLVDNKNFFRAYHMNKKYWITILINNNLDINLFYDLIDKSYNIVKK